MLSALRSRLRAALPAASALLLSAALLSCSKDPNATGVGLVPDTLRVGTLVATATGDSTVRVRLGGNGANLLTGKSGAYEARTIMEFNLGVYDSTAVIDSAVITARIHYAFPATTGDLGFEVHAMTATWSASTFTWDSLANSTEPAVAGTFLRTIAPTDTVITVRLDTNKVRAWWKSGIVSLQLVPSPASGIVVGFDNSFTTAADYRLALNVHYRAPSGDSTIALTLARRVQRVVFVATDDLTGPPTGLTVQAGVARRVLLRFDSLGIPPLASVTSAVLELAVDSTASITGAFTRDSLYVHLLRRNAAPYDSLALQLICGPVTEGGQKFFRADIRAIVQQWISREPNLGVLVRAYGDFTTLDKFQLHDMSAPLALQPKIRITYTLLPQ